MSDQHSAEKKQLRRVLAWIAIFALLLLYAMTLVFSLIDSPLGKRLLAASLFATVFIPVLCWVFLLTIRLVKGRGQQSPKDLSEPEDEK